MIARKSEFHKEREIGRIRLRSLFVCLRIFNANCHLHMTPVIHSQFQSIYSIDSQMFAGSIPDGVIGKFYLCKHSDRTMALGYNQPLTEMSTKNISWG
jgi:hypothetical protein